MLLYIHRDRMDYKGWGAQDNHIDFHTAPELWDTTVQCGFTSTETIWTITDGEPGQPLQLSHSSWALFMSSHIAWAYTTSSKTTATDSIRLWKLNTAVIIIADDTAEEELL